ncbi:MAG TPA: hypothetical protein VJV23_11755 [Candidatus Polarisedimenticolia bacterium]|nr:hypothetical protein [Candidatus Polarisedimenticolia bacterium]
MTAESFLRLLLALQGIYYLLTGIWPLVDIASFQAVTGPKQDLWLVRTVGVLVAVIGGSLLAAARGCQEPGAAVLLLAAGSALGLAAIDVRYALTGVISPVYLADAAAELGIAAALSAAAWHRRRRRLR